MKKLSVLIYTLIIIVCCGKNSSAIALESFNFSTSVSEKTIIAANKFIGSLNSDQQKAVVVEYNNENAVKWTNLPCGLACRIGISLGTLNETQLAYAKAVVKAAMGTLSGRGYDQAMQILTADDLLGANRDGYSSGNYIIAFLGKPSPTGKWQFQFGGHHLAVNLTFEDGKVIGASPFFIGLEPRTWTSKGVTYAPLKDNQGDMLAMLASLSTEQSAAAKLNSHFEDVFVGPGKDGKFPATKAGLRVGTLNKKQKALVLEAIKVWVQNADDETAKKLIASYTKDLDNTYIAYSGSTELASKADYVRIDGPGVWIEFACQPGAVYPEGVHYHTIYRDHTLDYGGNFNSER